MQVPHLFMFILVFVILGSLCTFQEDLNSSRSSIPTSSPPRPELEKQESLIRSQLYSRDDKRVKPTTSLLFFVLVVFIYSILEDLLSKFPIPIPILLIAGGGVLGWFSYFYDEVYYFLEITHMHPRELMLISVPAFVFRTAYNTDTRLFYICFGQILLVGIVGMLVSSLLIGLALMVTFQNYGWAFETAYLFGIIASTTYPHMIIDILKTTGQSKPLCVLLEGEYLIGDAYAMMMFNAIIFKKKSDITVFAVLLPEIRWVLGIVIGVVFGKLLTFLSQTVIRSANHLIMFTTALIYLTFYICEEVQGCSGVFAVALIGLMLGRVRDSLSNNMGSSLSYMWEMLCRITETLVFVIIGLMVVDSVIGFITVHDVGLVFVNYIICKVSRMVLYLVLHPLLSRMGSGISWQNATVAAWGGMHGILSLMLALIASRSENFEQVGTKFTIHITLMLLLTYLINGTTEIVLLKKLGLLDISPGRLASMKKATDNLQDVRERFFSILKMDKYLPVVNWEVVDAATVIINPYRHGDREKADSYEDEQEFEGPRLSVCPNCRRVHVGTPTANQLKETRRLAKLKMLSARKTLYWQQLQRGMLSQLGAYYLQSCTDTALARDSLSMDVEELVSVWSGTYLYKFYVYCFKQLTFKEKEFIVADVNQRWRVRFFMIATRKSFILLYYLIIIFHSVIIIIELSLKLSGEITWGIFFKAINIIFFAVYATEIIIKVGVYGIYLYSKPIFNLFDLAFLTITAVNIVIDCFVIAKYTESWLIFVSHALRILQLARLIRLLKVLIPLVKRFLYLKIHEYLIQAHEIGNNFVWAEKQMTLLLDFIVIYEKLHKELKSQFDNSRFDMIRRMANIQAMHPNLGINVKTMHAIQNTLVQLKETVRKLKELDGIVDNQEYSMLIDQIDEMFRAASSFDKMDSSHTIFSTLNSVPWVNGNEDFACFIEERGNTRMYRKDEKLYTPGQTPLNVHVVISGTSIIQFKPGDCNLENQALSGRLPIIDCLANIDLERVCEHGHSSELVEMLQFANMIGELGILTGRQYNSTVMCDYLLEVLSLSVYDLKDAGMKFKDVVGELDSLIWKSVAASFVPVMLLKTLTYVDMSLDVIMSFVARSVVVKLHGAKVLINTSAVKDMVLLEGMVRDEEGHEYVGSRCIPRTIQLSHVKQKIESASILMIIPEDGIEVCHVVEENNQLKVEPLTLAKCELHATKGDKLGEALQAFNRTIVRYPDATTHEIQDEEQHSGIPGQLSASPAISKASEEASGTLAEGGDEARHQHYTEPMKEMYLAYRTESQ